MARFAAALMTITLPAVPDCIANTACRVACCPGTNMSLWTCANRAHAQQDMLLILWLCPRGSNASGQGRALQGYIPHMHGAAGACEHSSSSCKCTSMHLSQATGPAWCIVKMPTKGHFCAKLYVQDETQQQHSCHIEDVLTGKVKGGVRTAQMSCQLLGPLHKRHPDARHVHMHCYAVYRMKVPGGARMPMAAMTRLLFFAPSQPQPHMTARAELEIGRSPAACMKAKAGHASGGVKRRPNACSALERISVGRMHCPRTPPPSLPPPRRCPYSRATALPGACTHVASGAPPAAAQALVRPHPLQRSMRAAAPARR